MANEIKIERPAVLIGLGGTGKEVLLNLRRQFFERYGVKTLPHIAQVVIDTDGRRRHLDGSDYDEFASEVDFEDDLVVTPLNQALRNYRENRAQYPHIDSWLDRSLDTHGEIIDGAGQIRAFGRLAFFHHYQKIRERLDRAYRSVTDRASWDRSLEDYGIRLDPDFSGVETWLIFSVAGGTGAGMFLDTAFLARQTARRYGGGEARSIILLPTAFSSAVPQHVSEASEHRVFANAYASLMELETYNYQRSQEGDARHQMQFSVQWTPELYRQQVTEVGPVFVNSWLIDNEPRSGGGQVHGERMVLCQMIAEWLFLQYGAIIPELAMPIRSNRSNDSRDLVPLAQVRIRHSHGDEAPAHGEDPFQDEVILLFSRRYSSFGLSKIYIPTANLAGQAYARLVRDLTQLCLQGRNLSDTRRDVMGQLNPQLHLPLNPEVNGFTSAMVRRLSLDGGKDPLARRFQRLIQDEYDKLRLAGFEERSEVAAREWFELEIMRKLLDSANASASKRGEVSLRIASENATAAREEIFAALDAFVTRALATPGERIEFAGDVLRLVIKDFMQLASEVEEKVKREELTGNRLQQQLETLLNWATDHRGFDRRKLFEAAFAKMRDRAMAEFRRQVLVAAANVAREVVQHVGVGRHARGEDGQERIIETGLLRALQDVRETLENIGKRANERIFAFRNQPSSSLNCRVTMTSDENGGGADVELDAIYRTAANEPVTDDDLQAIEERLYVSLGNIGFSSPWFLRDRSDAAGVEDSFDELLRFAGRELSYLPKRMEDALQRFDHKFRRNEMRGQYEAELDRVMRRGEPWLPPFEHNAGGSEAFRHLLASRYVACSNRAAEGPRRTLLEHTTDCEEVSGPLDTVYFESEVAGVPLFAVRHLDLYRQAYLGYLAAPDPATRVVHVELDLEKFVDLIPFSSDEMRLRRRAIRSFIRGLVSGVIRPDSSERDGWQFLERTGTAARPVARSLGRYKTAIQRLSRYDSPLCDALVREVERHYNQNLIYDDLGRIYFAIDEMKEKPPIAGSEWTGAAESVLRDMREKHGPGIMADAREAGAGFDKWAHQIHGRSQHPFVQVTSLVSAA
jgi:hypothetical protein